MVCACVVCVCVCMCVCSIWTKDGPVKVSGGMFLMLGCCDVYFLCARVFLSCLSYWLVTLVASIRIHVPCPGPHSPWGLGYYSV